MISFTQKRNQGGGAGPPRKDELLEDRQTIRSRSGDARAVIATIQTLVLEFQGWITLGSSLSEGSDSPGGSEFGADANARIYEILEVINGYQKAQPKVRETQRSLHVGPGVGQSGVSSPIWEGGNEPNLSDCG